MNESVLFLQITIAIGCDLLQYGHILLLHVVSDLQLSQSGFRVIQSLSGFSEGRLCFSQPRCNDLRLVLLSRQRILQFLHSCLDLTLGTTAAASIVIVIVVIRNGFKSIASSSRSVCRRRVAIIMTHLFKTAFRLFPQALGWRVWDFGTVPAHPRAWYCSRHAPSLGSLL